MREDRQRPQQAGAAYCSHDLRHHCLVSGRHTTWDCKKGSEVIEYIQGRRCSARS